MVSKEPEAVGMTALQRVRAAILLVGLPTGLVGLAHLNIHVASGVPFAPGRLVVPALLGLGLAILLVRELGRRAEQRAFLASLEAARAEAVRVAAEREELLLRAQDQIRQLRSEQTMSLITLGAVHDLRNLLVPVATGAELLREEPDIADEVAEQLDMAADRGRELCNRILEARRGTGRTSEPLAVEVVLEEAARSAVVLLGRDVEMMLDVEPGVIEFDRDDLFQMVHNVVGNSVNARATGLRIRVTGRKVANDRYEIRIGDNGPGLPEGFSLDARTLRRKGDETHGFGLRIVQAIVFRNDTQFRLESTGEGAVAVFEVRNRQGSPARAS